MSERLTDNPSLFRLRVRYGKRDRLKYLGHLEVIHTIERIVRRAGLPYAVTQGFSPHMRVGFSSALPVGTSSTCEWYDLFMTEFVGLDEAFERLAVASPADLAPIEAAYIDVEHALEPAYARALGVDIDSLLISQPDTGEQALEITEQLVRSGALDVVVVDSVAALLPRSELEGEMGESSVGVIARLMSQALRKLAGTVSRTNCIVVFINQLREKIGVMYGNPETTPGGRALKYFSSVRIDVRRIETLKVGGEMIGNRTRAKIVKNKVAPPFKEAEFDIIYGEGISKIGEIVDLGVKLDLIDKAGAWYTYGDVRVQGRDSMKEFLREHPDVSDQIEAEIRANAHKLMSPQARKAAIASGRAVEVAADDFQG